VSYLQIKLLTKLCAKAKGPTECNPCQNQNEKLAIPYKACKVHNLSQKKKGKAVKLLLNIALR
tara:strand:- start:227 stop:415 length:189 start_codon:yes stop_codon:yes gene_type:complete